MADESLLQVARIAAGEFVMGAEDGDEDEKPPHRTYVDEFCIGTHPVTNAEYADFVRETAILPPPSVALPVMVSGALEGEFRALASGVLLEQRHPARRSRSASRDARRVRRRGSVL